MTNEQQAHEFVPNSIFTNQCEASIQPDVRFKRRVTCGQPRTAAIHRLANDTKATKCVKCEHEARSYGKVRYATCHDIGNRLCDCICSFAPASEPQAAPPNTIWISKDWSQTPPTDYTRHWFPSAMREGDISYTRTSTTEGLAEALRNLSPRILGGWGACWCERNPSSANIVDHEGSCTAARTALARWEVG